SDLPPSRHCRNRRDLRRTSLRQRPFGKIVVFDDSSAANHQKYFSPLEQTTVSDLSYVDLTEKTQFIGFLNRDLLTAFHDRLGHG
ncbi:MAG: hypothetical protein WBW78_11620, partial [Terrimicrobiaceae bacterium]